MEKVKGFENYYICENGKVINAKNGKEKKPYINKQNGYLYVDLWKDNKAYKKPIHRLIAEAFIPNPKNKLTIDHKDGNRRNNDISNLRWATYSENNSRFNTIGVRNEKVVVKKYNEERKKRGGGHQAWKEVVEEKTYNSITDVAKEFGLTRSNISLLLEKGTIGRRGKTRGYKFQYLNNKRHTIKKV